MPERAEPPHVPPSVPLTADESLRRMMRLHSVAVDQLPVELGLQEQLEAMVRAALDITGADMCNIQIADERGVLTVAAHAGFLPAYLEHFACVDPGMDCPCTRALAARQRVTFDDIAVAFPEGSAARVALSAAGVRAVQATPLFARTGRLVGVFSTDYRQPHRFDETERQWLDLVAARAALAIERHQLEATVASVQAELERALADRTGALQAALDSAAAGTFRIDLREGLVQWDERARVICGAITHTVPFDPEFRHVPGEGRMRLQEAFARMLRGQDEAWDHTVRLHRPDGSPVWVRGVGRVERDAQRQAMAISGLCFDVTKEQEILVELGRARTHESQAAMLVDRVFSGAAEGILLVNDTGTIERANASLEAMFGYAPGELQGRPLAELVPESSRARHTEEHVRFFIDPRARPMGKIRDLAGRRKDGTTFPIEVGLTHLETEDGPRAIAFVSDITERRRAEDELRRSNALLQLQADRLRHRTEQLRRLASELTLSEQQTRERLAKVVHDHLQQVLFSAKLRIDRLVNASQGVTDVQPLAVKVQDDLETAIAAARSLSVELFPPTLHHDGLATALVWLAHWMHDKYGLTVEVAADPRVVVKRKDLRTLAFESVRELLFNVVKHAGVKRATVTMTHAQGHLAIAVSDQGVGFDPATVMNGSGRAGWGLFGVQERIDLLGGSLDVASAPGQGSRFTIVIPVADHEERPGRALRILLADDHAVARAGLREMLADRAEFEIVGEAVNGARAIELAHALKPDAIIMDVSMPEVDGIEATRRIHAELPDIQIFGLSTAERGDARHAIEAAGAAGYFSKGDDAQLLVDRLLSVHARR